IIGIRTMTDSPSFKTRSGSRSSAKYLFMFAPLSIGGRSTRHKCTLHTNGRTVHDARHAPHHCFAWSPPPSPLQVVPAVCPDMIFKALLLKLSSGTGFSISVTLTLVGAAHP